jgi:hypothetical protein
MFSIIMTWVGALFGIVVLLAMAFGAFVVDVNDALDGRDERRAEAEPKVHTATPAG